MYVTLVRERLFPRHRKRHQGVTPKADFTALARYHDPLHPLLASIIVYAEK